MSSLLNSLAFLSLPGGTEWVVIALFGLLIFGKRLPEVGKSLGRSIVEFKKGLKGVEDDVNNAIDHDQAEMLPPPEKKSESTPKPAASNTEASSPPSSS
ncbi:MAG: twin-arginine translocase TatA/TatE family subunit [Phycisphaerales bacterium]|nr:twin-arginine translocase TatA/TatE family subunit [Phycisphaerales bacterium]